MKKILCVILTIVGIIVIYSHYGNKKINYVSIGDNQINDIDGYNNYIRDFLVCNNKSNSFNNLFSQKSIINLIKDIENNRTIWSDDEEFFIKKVLRESDVLVINIGMEEFANFYDKYNMANNYFNFSEMYNKLEVLIKEINKYAKGKIIFIGYYNPTMYYDSKTDEFFYHVNLRLNRLMMDNSITYIDMYQLVKGNNFKKRGNSSLLNSDGSKKLASMIEFYL